MSRDSSSRKRKLDTETTSCHEVNHYNGFFVCVVVVSVEGRWENQNCSYHQSLNQSLPLVDGLTDSRPGLVLEAKMSQLIRFSGKTVTEKIMVVDRQHREVVLATVSVEIWGRSA